MNDIQLDEIRKKVKKHLDKNRYRHTISVMHCAAALAMRYDVDMKKAMLAGLLHDCAKCIPAKEKFALCRKYKIPVSKVEEENPSLLHAKIGAVLAKEKYHITDKEICHAIEVHTTGCPAMSLLDKIIYIADFIEPYRFEAPNLPQLRKLAFTDIDLCLRKMLHDSLEYLYSKKAPVDPMTEKTYLYYK